VLPLLLPLLLWLPRQLLLQLPPAWQLPLE
jgi:hypothetical protein